MLLFIGHFSHLLSMLRLVICGLQTDHFTTLVGVPIIFGWLLWHSLILIIGSQYTIKRLLTGLHRCLFLFYRVEKMSEKNAIFCFSPNSSDSLTSSFESAECYYRDDVPLYPGMESHTYMAGRFVTREPSVNMDEPIPQPSHSVAQNNYPEREKNYSFIER